MKYDLANLKEQKYLGLKTKILFKDHDDVDFGKLHVDVICAEIQNIDPSQRFMAMDSDFLEDSFCYTPLVPVTVFEGNSFHRFIREEGEYYCFDVAVKDLGPQWFDECIRFMKQNNIKIDRAFDLEFYSQDYMSRVLEEGFNYKSETIQIIFKKRD